MQNYLVQLFGGPTAQSEPLAGREQQMVRNSNDGYVFPVNDWVRLERFLVLGAEGGSFYARERELSLDNAQAVKGTIAEDGLRTVRMIVKISEAGRAPKNDPALFALAMAASFGDERTRRAAFRALPIVARTGTHLFRFAAFAGSMRGWGRGLRKAVAGWYLAGDTADKAYQAVKYRQRDGWTHRDLLRLSHPKAEGARDALFGWVAQGRLESGRYSELTLVEGFEQAQTADSERTVSALVRKFGLTREMLPTGFLDSREVWLALFERMPLGALVRNLATLTRVGVLTPMSDETARVVERLSDAEALRKARLHPVAVLAALLTYKAGQGVRGRHQWQPVPAIVDALDAAFERAFDSVEPTGRRFYLGLDVFGLDGLGRGFRRAGPDSPCCGRRDGHGHRAHRAAVSRGGFRPPDASAGHCSVGFVGRSLPQGRRSALRSDRLRTADARRARAEAAGRLLRRADRQRDLVRGRSPRRGSGALPARDRDPGQASRCGYDL